MDERRARVRQGGKVKGYVGYALKQLEEHGSAELVGDGPAIAKLVTVVEILKRKVSAGRPIEAHFDLSRAQETQAPRLLARLVADGSEDGSEDGSMAPGRGASGANGA